MKGWAVSANAVSRERGETVARVAALWGGRIMGRAVSRARGRPSAAPSAALRQGSGRGGDSLILRRGRKEGLFFPVCYFIFLCFSSSCLFSIPLSLSIFSSFTSLYSSLISFSSSMFFLLFLSPPSLYVFERRRYEYAPFRISVRNKFE